MGTTGKGVPSQQIQVKDDANFSNSRYMESFESRHSDHSFTGRLGSALGITAAPLRLDSQAKYGNFFFPAFHFPPHQCLATIIFHTYNSKAPTIGLHVHPLINT